jgi:hypothetical protein
MTKIAESGSRIRIRIHLVRGMDPRIRIRIHPKMSWIATLPREMENIRRGPTFGDFVTILTEESMQDITNARLQSKRVQTPFSSPILNVCMDSQNIPCATLKRRGSWVIGYLYISEYTEYNKIFLKLEAFYCYLEISFSRFCFNAVLFS